jgi:hypothetical protein
MAKVARVYDTQQKADEAVQALHDTGFSEARVSVTIRQAEPAHATETDEAPAESPSATEYVVIVDAPFGWAQTAEDTLDRFGPLPVTVAVASTARRSATAKKSPERDHASDRAAPLSAALGLPVLKPFQSSVRLMPDAAPLSNKLGMPVLSPDRPLRDPLPSAWSLSGALGLPMLSSDPAPLSSAIGRDVLVDEPAPLSRKLGWRVLLDEPAPLSSRLHWKTLTDRQ